MKVKIDARFDNCRGGGAIISGFRPDQVELDVNVSGENTNPLFAFRPHVPSHEESISPHTANVTGGSTNPKSAELGSGRSFSFGTARRSGSVRRISLDLATVHRDLYRHFLTARENKYFAFRDVYGSNLESMILGIWDKKKVNFLLDIPDEHEVCRNVEEIRYGIDGILISTIEKKAVIEALNIICAELNRSADNLLKPTTLSSLARVSLILSFNLAYGIVGKPAHSLLFRVFSIVDANAWLKNRHMERGEFTFSIRGE